MIFFIEVNPEDITFYWKGYNNTLPQYISESLKNLYKMNDMDKKQMEALFDKAKKFHQDDWAGSLQTKSYRQVLDILPQIMIQNAPRDSDLLATLENYTFKNFLTELETWMRAGTCVWFVHGNFTPDQANEIATDANNTMNLIPINPVDLEHCNVLKLTQGQSILYQQ